LTKSDRTHEIGSFRFDTSADILSDASGEPVPLRPQTVRVLSALVSSRGSLVSKDDLMREIWADTHVTDDSLVQCVSEIRKALGTTDGKLLRTVPKQGYCLDAAVGPSETQLSRRRVPTRALMAVSAGLVTAIVLLAALWILRDAEPSTRPTVAVLPFVNMSGDPQQDYLSFGLAEDLLTDLSKVGALTVLSRGSTFGYGESPDRAGRIADDLGATHLVDGSVQRDGDSVRISVQLVDADTGVSLWAERYDRKLGDLFELQDEVRTQIVAAMAVKLAPQEEERLRANPTREISAYDLFLKGRYQEATLARDGVDRAIELYRQAIEVDPTYGNAYARLANMYDFSSRFGWSEDVDRDRALSLEMAETAVRLEPDNPFAHWTLGRVLARLGKDDESRTRALEELGKAIALDPNNADAYAFISLLYIGDGKPDEARHAIENAYRLNQTAPWWYAQNRGIISYFEGDFDGAIAAFETAAEKSPTSHFTRLWLGAAYARAGLGDDAEWQIEEANLLGAPETVGAILTANSVIQHPEYKDEYARGLRAAGVRD
jgi:TolB-like protein/DNA-binding winged helix-turn-helix (wHTH) protein